MMMMGSKWSWWQCSRWTKTAVEIWDDQQRRIFQMSPRRTTDAHGAWTFLLIYFQVNILDQLIVFSSTLL
jgi:hypothetical protein